MKRPTRGRHRQRRGWLHNVVHHRPIWHQTAAVLAVAEISLLTAWSIGRVGDDAALVLGRVFLAIAAVICARNADFRRPAPEQQLHRTHGRRWWGGLALAAFSAFCAMMSIGSASDYRGLVPVFAAIATVCAVASYRLLFETWSSARARRKAA